MGFAQSDSGYATLTIKKVRKDREGPEGARRAASAVPVLRDEDKPEENPAAPAAPPDADAQADGVPVSSLSEFIG